MPEGRGTHRVVLGMAAGVGKTYRALQEVRAARDAGRDAVVAYLEPHGRAETVAQAQGLELLPRRAVSDRGAELTELDVPGVLARAPELCLVDELAHANPPGLEHPKRWQDVEELLAAGLDVVSTVNVQHLESLNDVVADITGVRVRETLPDHVLEDADEVVLVDLSPEALLDRVRAGRIYPPDRVEAALNGFFRIEHLQALRELVLRQVAEDVEARRGEAPVAVGERLLAWVQPTPGAEAVLRRAWRSAHRLQAPLDVLVTVPPRPPREDEQRALDGLSRVAGRLGLSLVVRPSDDPVAVVVAEAGARATTYLLLAPPPPPGVLRRWAPGPVDRLLAGLPGVDLRLVREQTVQR